MVFHAPFLSFLSIVSYLTLDWFFSLSLSILHAAARLIFLSNCINHYSYAQKKFRLLIALTSEAFVKSTANSRNYWCFSCKNLKNERFVSFKGIRSINKHTARNLRGWLLESHSKVPREVKENISGHREQLLITEDRKANVLLLPRAVCFLLITTLASVVDTVYNIFLYGIFMLISDMYSLIEDSKSGSS